MINALPLLLGDDGYQISRSVRLRSSASAYFNRTPASAGNRKTWTWSGWVKRGNLSNGYALIATTSGSAPRTFFVYDSDSLWLLDQPSGTNASLTSTAKFRDPSAWYHVILSVDTTQATSTNRVKMYVNGVEQTISGTYPTQNTDMEINRNVAHTIGSYSTNYFDGYLTEINFIDGQALTPSSFGQNNPITGVWEPKKYTGTYGTNGFYLNFSDPSAATAAAIGADRSGNGNNWTPNNISVTSGATYDSMLDVPTPWADGGNGRGNYSTLNPLISQATASSNLVSGNLEQNTTLTGTEVYALSTMALPSTGKYYAEISIVAASGVNTSATEIGIVSGPRTSGNNGGRLDQCPSSTVYRADGQKGIDAVFSAYGATWGNGDTIGIAVDMDSASITFYKNNTSQGAITSVDSQDVFMGVCLRVSGGTGYAYANFGQRPFAYTPPSGFKALHTGNLPEPTIKKGNQYFDATTFTANGTTQVVNNSGFQPDFLWFKRRDAAGNHFAFNSVVGDDLYLVPNLTDAEGSSPNFISSLNSNGFTMGTGQYANGISVVCWNWKEGATQGFDIVTYTGTGVNRTVAHSLGVAPAMVIIKRRDNPGAGTFNWVVRHWTMPTNNYLYLDNTTGQLTVTDFYTAVPTSSNLPLGVNALVNASGGSYVAYCFAEVAGFSRFGSYTGNGSADGPFVFCGFRPRWVMFKRTDTTGDWVTLDSSRDTFNAAANMLYPNLSNAETNVGEIIDFVSNGFKLRFAGGASVNANGGTYIFAAFAETPQKFSLAR